MAETNASTSSKTEEKAVEGDLNDQLLVVDIGKRQKRKRIKKLRKGRGKLFTKVQDLMADLREEGAIGENAQPVVIVVREKDRGFGRMPW